jgi:Mrp family chromosome partitioning ATPase
VQGLYDRLLGLLQTVDVSRNLEQENFSVLQKASDPKPANLSPPIALGLAVFMGIGAGLALIFLVERMDDRLLSLDEVSHQFMEWVVGQVPEVRNERKKRRPALLEGNDPRHIFAESYRSLRSALLFGVPLEAKPKTLLVTSAIPSEGKSTVAANLARTLAFGGSRVLLIDADLRRGVLHDLFGLPREPGLAELLARNGHSSALVSPGGDPDQGPGTRDQGTKGPGTRDQTLASFGGEGRGEEAPALDLTHFVVPTSIPNLFLLPCGGPQDRSGELLLGHRLDALLAQARADYDCVIMDSIPVFAADDTTSLAPKMDGVIFVVRNSFSSAGTVRGALEMLYERQARVLGLVYNRANPDAKSYHYYKYAAYDRSAKRA